MAIGSELGGGDGLGEQVHVTLHLRQGRPRYDDLMLSHWQISFTHGIARKVTNSAAVSFSSVRRRISSVSWCTCPWRAVFRRTTSSAPVMPARTCPWSVVTALGSASLIDRIILIRALEPFDRPGAWPPGL